MEEIFGQNRWQRRAAFYCREGDHTLGVQHKGYVQLYHGAAETLLPD
jgi:hypothetical protein